STKSKTMIQTNNRHRDNSRTTTEENNMGKRNQLNAGDVEIFSCWIKYIAQIYGNGKHVDTTFHKQNDNTYSNEDPFESEQV
ncbi:hypothetical protein CHS0354_031925, partial [Potamilus streckersoni]